MSQTPQVTGYRYSVYTRAVRMALAAKGARYDYVECDPFTEPGAAHLRDLHPFGRVPVFEQDGFRLWETQAVLDYVEATFDTPNMTPDSVVGRARMRQVMGIADSYLYWPLVRQAFSHGVFRPLMGEDGDRGEVDAGLAAAPAVLDALEGIAQEGLTLLPGHLCLDGCLLWPMLDYFAMLPEARRMLDSRPALTTWMRWMAATPQAIATRPDLPKGEQA